MDKLTQLLSTNPTIVGDGAMGTMLQAAGLTTGGSPEEWNVSHADVLRGIYQGYVDAGSQIITTNTFGGNRYRLALHDYQDRVRELNLAAARLAREVADAAPHLVLVAGDIGPTGEILFPLGERQPEEVRAAFAEQAAALAEGGVDFFLIETMSALEEVQAAIEGIRDASDLPIAATMTFDTHFRTMMGIKPAHAMQALYDLGIRVIGANCGNGPAEIERVVTELISGAPRRCLRDRPIQRGPAQIRQRHETHPLRRHARSDGRLCPQDAGPRRQLHRRVLRLDPRAHRRDEGRVAISARRGLKPAGYAR